MLTEMDKDIEITSSEEDVKETVQNTENCEPSEALQETSETEEAGTEETEEVNSDDNDKKKSKLSYSSSGVSLQELKNVTGSLLPRIILAAAGQEREREISLRFSYSS